MQFTLISTSPFAALYKEGDSKIFQQNNSQYKLIHHRFSAPLVFQLGRNSHWHSEKLKSFSIESLKQTLSLGNH